MTQYADFLSELERVRDHSKKIDRFSWTSDAYQRDLLSFVVDNADKGGCVIEVGAYKGGLTVQLATICEKLGLELYCIDAWDQAVQMTNEHLEGLGLSAHVHYATFGAFVASNPTLPKPVLLILDGDHSYDVVKADIADSRRLDPQPHAIAFHDFSLRHPTSGERVDEAVAEEFPAGLIRHIGTQFTGHGHATQANPQPDGHFWKVPGSEGAIVIIDA